MGRTMQDLGREYQILYRALSDPNYDLIDDNYRIIEDVRDFLYDYNSQSLRGWDGSELVELLMLRVRNKSRHVFAITVGMFPGYDNIEEKWKAEGYVDPNGYTWFAPN